MAKVGFVGKYFFIKEQAYLFQNINDYLLFSLLLAGCKKQHFNLHYFNFNVQLLWLHLLPL